MEGAEQCWTIPVDFGWSDVGSWPALAEVLSADDAGNILRGRSLGIDATDNILVGEDVVVRLGAILWLEKRLVEAPDVEDVAAGVLIVAGVAVVTFVVVVAVGMWQMGRHS